MKKSCLCRLATAGTALILSLAAAFPAAAASLAGNLSSVTKDEIVGWAQNEEDPSDLVTVELTISGGGGPGSSVVIPVKADQTCSDQEKLSGHDGHAFVYSIDWSAYDGDSLIITAEAVSGQTRTSLESFFLYNKPDETAVRKTRKKQTITVASNDFDGRNNHSSEENTGKLTAGKQNGPAKTESADEIETGEAGDYLGSYIASGYCGCEICSGNGNGLTYSGTVPKANHTIAADLNVFPLGTRLMIDGIVYTVEDMGGGINGNRLDIYFGTHEEALAYGLKKIDVYAVKETN